MPAGRCNEVLVVIVVPPPPPPLLIAVAATDAKRALCESCDYGFHTSFVVACIVVTIRV